ncbi:hypothetical protein C1H46_017910 [Malus baccata]|uniref:Uncharacterized protein n=1 Tax=Malus baccata TaxID=106549 RepID=A0A540MCJ6_MALBA|nr:hypothetical protein C1H46_017910 [Malus baccata]
MVVCRGTYPRVSLSSPCKPLHFPLTYFCHPHTCLSSSSVPLLSSPSVHHPSLLSLGSLLPEQHSHHVLRRLRTPNHHQPRPNLTPNTELEPKVQELRLEPQIGEPELRLKSKKVPTSSSLSLPR